jgi:hypothetical protein
VQDALRLIDGGDMVRDEQREAPTSSTHGVEHPLRPIVRQIDLDQATPNMITAVIDHPGAKFIEDAMPADDLTGRSPLI